MGHYIVFYEEKFSWLIRKGESKLVMDFSKSQKLRQTHMFFNAVAPSTLTRKQKFMGNLITEVLARDYSRFYKGGEIVRDMISKYKTNIAYQQACRAKQHTYMLLRDI